MRLTFRAKLVIGMVSLLAAVELGTVLALDRALTTDLLRQLDERLESQARAAAGWASEGRHPDKLAQRLAGVIRADVAVFDREARQLGDSAEPGGVFPRPAQPVPPIEVRQALDGVFGHATRVEPRSGVLMRYVAVPTDGELVVRLGVPMDGLASTIALMRTRLLWVALGGFAVAVGVALVLASFIAAPLRTITAATGRIVEGDYDVKLPPTTRDELGALASAVQTLAERLRVKMSELVTERERLRQLERVRRDFIANVSHELRTPVAAIQGYAETMLSREVPSETRREFLETIHRQSVRMNKLVADLLRLSALEAAPAESLRREPVVVAEVAREVLRTVSERAAALDVRLSFEVPPELVANGDGEALEHALQNLVDNAVAYNKRGGTVTLRATDEGVEVRIDVVDTGPGIAPEHLPRLFERFYRVDKGRSREVGGTGLGLAIVRHAVEGMGGRIEVSSAQGEGSRFSVLLPKAA